VFKFSTYIDIAVFSLMFSLQSIVASDINTSLKPHKLTLIHPHELEASSFCYDHVEKRYLTLLEIAVVSQDVDSLFDYVSSAYFDNKKLEMNRAIALAKKVKQVDNDAIGSFMLGFLLNSGVQDCNT